MFWPWSRFKTLELMIEVRDTRLNQTRLQLEMVESTNRALTQMNKTLTEDRQYLQQRMDKLVAVLSNVKEIPDISTLILTANKHEVDPPNERPYGDFLGDQYHVTAADPKYMAYDIDSWKKVLDPIHQKVKGTIGAALPEIADCDDWSLIMAGYVALAFKKAKAHLQGAFAMAQSDKVIDGVLHAYNAYMLDDGRVMVYEPQTGETVGDIRQTTDKYHTGRLEFKA